MQTVTFLRLHALKRHRMQMMRSSQQQQQRQQQQQKQLPETQGMLFIFPSSFESLNRRKEKVLFEIDGCSEKLRKLFFLFVSKSF